MQLSTALNLPNRQVSAGGFGYGASLALDLTSGTQTLDPRITFSRTSNATVTGPDGLIAYAPHNLLTYSEQVDNSAWIKVNLNVTANTVVAPDGTLTADVVSRTADGSATRNTRINFSTTQTGSYTYSQYVKPQGATVRVALRLQDNAGVGGHCVFDLEGAGTIVTSTSATGFVEKVGDWYRIAVTVSLTGSFSSIQSLMFLGAYGASTDPDSFAMWGAQLNVGALQPYYPTTVKNLLGYTQEFDNAAWTKTNAFVQTNLLTYSEQFDDAAWTKIRSTVTANVAVDPQGYMTADKLIENTDNNTHFIRQSPSLVGSTPHTVSVYLKADERTEAIIRLFSSGGWAVSSSITANLLTGSVVVAGSGATGSATDVGNGWYRVAITQSTNATTGTKNVDIFPALDGTDGYQGDGTSGIYIWGAQLVQGSTPGDYQRTEAAAKAVMYFAPDGSLTADKLVEDVANAAHLARQNASLLAGSPVTVSCYAKQADPNRHFSLIFENNSLFGGAFPFASFNLTTGAVAVSGTGSAEIVPIGNGWYRCSFRVTSTGSGTSGIQFRLQNATTVTNPLASYTGDGTSGLFIWGAQLSDSASLDPYVYNPVAAPAAAAYYGPRFDYDPVTLAPKGLLIEEQRTNLLLQSENFTTSWASNATTETANINVAPNGTTTANTITETTDNNFHVVFQSVSANGTVTFSVFVKLGAGGTRFFTLGVNKDANNYASATFDLTTGVSTQSVFIGTYTNPVTSVTEVSQGFYRCTLTTTTDTVTQLRFGMCDTATPGFVNRGSGAPYVGDTGQSIIAWGAQLEVGAFSTSYIPTTTAAATRAADVAVMQGANFSNWYNAAEGTLFTESRCPNGISGNINRIASLNDGTTSNRIEIDTGSAAATVGRIQVGGVSQGAPSAGSYTDFQLRKSALAIQVDNFTLAANTSLSSDTSALVAVVNRLMIGQSPATSSNYLNGHISRIAYFPRRLSNAELQGITS